MSQVATPSRTPAAKPAAPNKRRDLYQEVTDKIIAAIEAGTAPWQRPWTEVRAAGMPINGATERPYSGVNAVLLMMAAEGFTTDNRWFTMKQANDMGLRVRKGSTSTPVYFFKMMDVPGKDAMAPPTSDAPTSGNTADGKRIPFLTDYRVFHASQIEGLEPASAPENWAPIDAVQEIVARLNPDIRHGGNRAFYSPSGNFIQVPHKNAFETAAAYYGTLLHEIAHWSGHESRLNRSFSKSSVEYAKEELRAELCSTFLCGFLGVPGPVDPHASYIESWVKVLRSDNREIFRAAKDARQMADFLTGQLVLDVKPEPGESAQPTATMHPTLATPVQTMPTVSPAVSAVLAKARMGYTAQGRSRSPARRNGLVPIGAVLGDTAIASPAP